MLVTLVLTFIVILSVLIVLIKVRTPRYQLQRDNIICLLIMVTEGKATENDWSVFTAIPLRHDEALEAVRLRCIEIEEREYTGNARPPYLFSKKGIAELRVILEELQAEARLSPPE